MTILLSILTAIATSALVFAAMTVKGHREYRAKVHEMISDNYDEIIDLLEENHELTLKNAELESKAESVPKVLRIDEEQKSTLKAYKETDNGRTKFVNIEETTT